MLKAAYAISHAYRKLILFLYAKVNEEKNNIGYVGYGDTLPAPFTRDEEQALLKLRDTQPEYVRTMLIEHNLRLVVYIARKFENTGLGLEDLVSIGTIGLVKAVNTFDPVKNIKLATYATRCIENEILMQLRKSSKNKLVVSLDEPLNVDSDGNELLLSDILGTDGDIVSREIEDELDRELLLRAVKKLKPREKQIIEMRYGLFGRSAQTQKQVADILGISQSYISRLEKRIIDFLYREITDMQCSHQ